MSSAVSFVTRKRRRCLATTKELIALWTAARDGTAQQPAAGDADTAIEQLFGTAQEAEKARDYEGVPMGLRPTQRNQNPRVFDRAGRAYRKILARKFVTR